MSNRFYFFVFLFFIYNCINNICNSYINIKIHKIDKSQLITLKNNENDQYNNNIYSNIELLVQKFINDENFQNRIPLNEYDIEDDSFESYLRMHFNIIKNFDNKITFERFYKWRKQIGTDFTKDELKEIYKIVNTETDNCDLITFIILNIIIDENDDVRY